MKKLKDKTIVLGVTGGIAAYKSAELLRLLVKEESSVFVMMSEAATRFITPLTFQTLSGHPVQTSLFDLTQEQEMGHITLADRADLVVIAPATAHCLAKAAHGLADDLIQTVLLATKAPVLFCPAMNVNMWTHEATKENLRKLKNLGYEILDPDSGDLACGWSGQGRLPEPSHIVQKIKSLL